MAAMNSSVLACSYAGCSDLNAKLTSMPSVALPPNVSSHKLPVIKAQASDGRRGALVFLAATLFTAAASNSPANAGVIEQYLEKSKANKVFHSISLIRRYLNSAYT